MAAALNRMTIPQLQNFARNRKIKGYSGLSKAALLAHIRSQLGNNNNNGNGKVANLRKATPATENIIKGIFLDTSKNANANGKREAVEDAKVVARELTDDTEQENASDFFREVVPVKDREKFKRTWTDFVATQVLNGGFLEFQGMRFVDNNTDVYDAKRDVAGGGREVFNHILQPATRTRVYLKCKFDLKSVNSDSTNIVQGKPTPKWSDLESRSKGKAHCEPDLIVRTRDAIKIYELKMGQGKYEPASGPKEYHQLLRAYHLFSEWMVGNASAPRIELYFVGWSAPSDAKVVFGRPEWEGYLPSKMKVKQINGAGLPETGCPVNSELVTKIIKLLNIQKAISFFDALSPYFLAWGGQRSEMNALIENSSRYINTHALNYNHALKLPPLTIVTRSQAKTGAAAAKNKAVEVKGRGVAASVVAGARGVAQGVLRGVSALRTRYTARGNVVSAPTLERTYSTSPGESRRRLAHSVATARPGNFARSVRRVSNNEWRKGVAERALALKYNNAVINAVMSNANNFDEAYNTFVKEHGGAPNTNLGRQLVNALTNPPNNSWRNNFASKLEKKKTVNRRAGVRAAAFAV